MTQFTSTQQFRWASFAGVIMALGYIGIPLLVVLAIVAAVVG